MEIITKEQMDKLDGLIEKYSNPEQIEETVAGEPVVICREVDISPLLKRMKKLITQEQCEHIVTAALSLSKIMSEAEFVSFLHKNRHTLYFDLVYFVRPCDLNRFIEESKCTIEAALRNIRDTRYLDPTQAICFTDMKKVVETYTELTNFYEYIKKYPLNEGDVLKIISSKENS